jgi:hypothetical protein
MGMVRYISTHVWGDFESCMLSETKYISNSCNYDICNFIRSKH